MRKLLLLLLLSTPCFATIVVTAKVAGDVNGGGQNFIAATAYTSSAGNEIACGTRNATSSIVPTSVTDTAGDTFVQVGAASSLAGTGSTGIFYAENVTGNASNVVTAHFGSSDSYVGIVCFEWSGAATSTSLDAGPAGSTGTGSTLTSGTFSTGTANEIIFACGIANNIGLTWTAGSGYTNMTSGPTNDMGCESQIVSSTQASVTATMTISASQNYVIQVASFKAAGGVAAPKCNLIGGNGMIC